MKIEVDKKALEYTIIAAGMIAVIFMSGNIVFKAAERLARSSPLSPAATVIGEGEPDENSFYLQPPTGSPVFLSDADVAKKATALVWEKRDFLLADLDAMSISWYKEGILQKTFPVAGKAGEESFFAVPSGFYSIQGKAQTHVSQISRGKLPWAIYLFGNYLISGGGAAKSSSAAVGAAASAAGGIQLASGDAKELFAVAGEGMPMLVSGGISTDEVAFSYFRKTALPHSVPEVSAASALAADLETGQILFEKNKTDIFPIASITKFVTALVARERIDSRENLVVGSEALRVYGNAAGLTKGEIFRADELLYAMILPSSNNAAKMFELAVPDFIGRMNEKAAQIGMTRTSFGDSSGMSLENVSSAADLFLMLKHLDAADPEILAISKEKSHTAPSLNKARVHVWNNINWPRGDMRFLGGKAGFTDDSLQTMAGIYHVRTTEYGGRRIAIVVLGSRNRIRDIRSVITYLEQNYIYGFVSSKDRSKLHPIASSGADIYEAVQNILRP